MKNLSKSQKYGLSIIVVLVSLTLLASIQAFAFEAQKPGDGGRDADHPRCCDRAMSCHGAGKWQAGMHHHKQHRIWSALKKLDLTDGQKSAFQEIRMSMKKDMIRKRADLKIAQMELHEQLHKDTVDMNVVESQVKKIEGLKAAMILNAIKSREEIKSKLTPDQRKHLVDLIQDSHQSPDRLHQEG